MRICFVGNTHLTFCMSVAAARRGFVPVPEEEFDSAELVVLANDTPTDNKGRRKDLLYKLKYWTVSLPVVLCSQLKPGFCRKINFPNLYHQPETLRILDATARAYAPDCIVVGCMDKTQDLPAAYQTYLDAFQCPVVKTDYESAEFTKIAVNMYLASQVDTTNRLAAAAGLCGADWNAVKFIMEYDRRIGTYTTPGRWEDSIHLLRDYVTLKEIEDAR